MNITEITTKAGAHTKRRRVGRGEGSGMGKTSSRGNKGAGARSGGRKGGMYEGGVFPLFRRLPKFGFNNAGFRTEYQVVNLKDLDAVYAQAKKFSKRRLAEMLVLKDPRSEYLTRFNDLTKSEAAEDVEKIVAFIWSNYSKTGRMPDWLT